MTSSETTLAEMAVEFWKLIRAIERGIDAMPERVRERMASQTRFSASRLDKLLLDHNMSLQSFDGMDFEVNLPATAINADEFSESVATIVERTLEPAVICDMRIVLGGKVLLTGKQ